MGKFLSFFAYFLMGLLISMVVSFSVYYYYTTDLPEPESLLPSSARLLYSNGEPLYLSRSIWINLDEVPKQFVDFLLASEDRGFYRHAGLMVRGILRALFVNIITGDLKAQGGSTITQQLVRSLYLSPEKTFERKIKEIAIALWIERVRTKDEILEMYINSVYLGNGLYGFEAGSIYYFGKSLKELSLPEMAVLIGIVKSPENFNPFKSEKLAKEKGKVVVDAVLDAGLITPEDAKKLKEKIESLKFEKKKLKFDEDLFWRIIREAQELTGLSLQELRSGYEIVTTLDEELQGIVNRVLSEDMACVAVDNLGRILAFKGKGAGIGRRQVGSAIKPIYYLMALLNDYSLYDILPDLPIDISGWKPENFTKKYKIYVHMWDALLWSRNVPSVMLFSHLGKDVIRKFIKGVFHIEGFYPDDLTLALGTLETSPEELLKFYISLSTTGVVVEPTIIKEIRKISGGAVYAFVPGIIDRIPSGLVDSRKAILKLKGILREVARRGTGRKAWIRGKEIFGKTGTAERHAWFIGGDDYTIMAVVRDGTDLTGGEDVAPIWRDIMIRWGKFEGKVNYERFSFSGYGKLIIDDKILRYIDVERTVEYLEEHKTLSGKFGEFLKMLDVKQKDYILSEIENYRPGFLKELGVETIWKK